MEKQDKTIRETAERETFEEIGLELRAGEYVGRLDDVSGANTPVVISPFLYHATPVETFKLNHEVEDAFWFGLNDLLNVNRHTKYRFRFMDKDRVAPGVDLLGPGRPILWGLTYRIVARLFELLGYEMPDVRS